MHDSTPTPFLNRRQFLVATAGIGSLAFSSPALSTAKPVPTDLCESLRDSCLRNNCDIETNPVRRVLCQMQCEAEYSLCRVQGLLNKLSDALEEGLDWLRQHPEVVIGAIVVVLGITFIVATGGAGAPLLIFA